MEPIRILHLEGVASDAQLVRRALSTAGLPCEVTWVEDEESFRAALDRAASDLVLADNALPGLDGRVALRLSRERLPDAPFILVTGSLGEEYAVDMLQLGATDFVLKDRLGRLAPAVRRALGEAEEWRRRRETEARVRRAQRMESIGTLAGGIAHDLNNVLSPILMAVEILKKRMSGDARSLKTLANIESSATRGAALVRQILGFTRGVQGERLRLQVPDLIHDLESLLASTLPANIERRIDAAPDLWSVIGDAIQLQQVLLNLCVNARDAMPSGGVLEIVARNVTLDTDRVAQMEPGTRAGPHVELTVRDTGAGIPPELLDRIFEPFFTTKPVGQGTGLGLSTSVGIVRSHGGSITASSELGKGSTLQVYLPAAPRSEQRNAAADAPAAADGRGERILVVDDEPAVLELMRETLEVAGYRIVTAAGGAAAVDLYSQPGAGIAAVITDLSMAGMSGHATVRKLRWIDPGVRLIVMSGLEPEDVAPPLFEGVQAFLRKPVSAERLLSTLRAVLDAEST